MTKTDTAQLRSTWAKAGNPDCYHPNIELEADNGYLSGSYVCFRCGAVLLKSSAAPWIH